MDLAQKLKNARQEAGLSQRQLCGDTITRNMLSQIENGTAHPSMQTLRILAARLHKPVSYFLEEEAVLQPNRGCMEMARKAWAAGDAAGVLQALQSWQADSDTRQEKELLCFLATVELARQAVIREQLPYALSLLRPLLTAEGIYISPALRREVMYLLARAGETVTLPSPDEMLLLHARQALEAGDPARADRLLCAVEVRSARWALLRGKALQAQGAYQEAVRHYHQAELTDPREAIPALEVCYRELGDYKQAYEYAKKTLR